MERLWSAGTTTGGPGRCCAGLEASLAHAVGWGPRGRRGIPGLPGRQGLPACLGGRVRKALREPRARLDLEDRLAGGDHEDYERPVALRVPQG